MCVSTGELLLVYVLFRCCYCSCHIVIVDVVAFVVTFSALLLFSYCCFDYFAFVVFYFVFRSILLRVIHFH